MFEYKGINWLTDVTPELIESLRNKASTVSIPVAVGIEIYELGNRLYQNFNKKKISGATQNERAKNLVLNILSSIEAQGYRRVGYEVLYFQEPHGTYTIFTPFTAEEERKEQERILNRFIEFYLTIKPDEEGRLISVAVDKRVRTTQTEIRKVELLNKDPTMQLLLEDLLNEVVHEKQRDSGGQEFWDCSLRGINAGIQRYKQLHQILTE